MTGITNRAAALDVWRGAANGSNYAALCASPPSRGKECTRLSIKASAVR